MPSCSWTSGIASSSAASMPSPRRSTLMSPRSAQSSLSHWMTFRPGMAAGSSGTTSSSRPAAITAREIEVDVGPLATLLGEEALEEEFHADRVDRRDAERVADRAVGGGASTLHEDAALATEADDVPDDQEIAAEIEPADEAE